MAVIKALVLPPTFQLVLVVVGFVLMLRWRKIGSLLIVISLISLYLLSIVPVSKALLVSLEIHPPLNDRVAAADRGAIVVLAGGRYLGAPEYDGDTVSASTLERLRYAAALAEKTDLPILVSGGAVYDGMIPEATLMNRVLEQGFGTSAEWMEIRSRNTAENAEYSARILQDNDIDNIFLVTHAVHMRRSVRVFENAGLEVTPAPTAYRLYKLDQPALPWFIPNIGALNGSHAALYEYFGLLWYSIKSYKL